MKLGRVIEYGLVAAFVLLLFPGLVLGSPADFRYQADLKVEGVEGNYARLELPDAVIAGAAQTYSDVRIYAGSEEVPYALAPLYVPQESTGKFNGRISDKGVDAKGNTTFLVNLSALELNTLNPVSNAYLLSNKMLIITQDKNFVRKVKVESSSSPPPGEWVTLQEAATIFDLSAEHKGSNLEVSYGQTSSGWLRVTIFNEGSLPLKVDGVTVQYSPSNPEFLARPKARQVSFSSTGSVEGRETFLVDLLQPNLPTQSLEVKTKDQNFNRFINVEGSNDKKNWSQVTSTEIYSYELDQLKTSKMLMEYPLVKYRYLRLTVDNRDDQPLKIKDVTLKGVNPWLVVKVNPGKAYTLYWGNDKAAAPAYDLETIKNKLNYTDMSALKVGDVQENKSYRVEDTRPWTERNSWLLQLALVLVVVILIGIIVRSFQKIRPH